MLLPSRRLMASLVAMPAADTETNNITRSNGCCATEASSSTATWEEVNLYKCAGKESPVQLAVSVFAQESAAELGIARQYAPELLGYGVITAPQSLCSRHSDSQFAFSA